MAKIVKEQNNTKYNRINQIYEMLKNNVHGMTITELSNELDVSTKTIQRDLYEVLADFGAIKDGRYWKINPKLTEDNLASNEKLILGILDDMAKNAGSIFYSKAHNLLQQVTQQLEHPIFTNIDSEALDENTLHRFETIEKAIKNKNEITFKYIKNKFKVKPLKLAFFDGFWYLLCLDSNDKDTFKKFHLKSINDLKTTAAIFDISTQIEEKLRYANSVWFNFDEPYSVRLFLSKEIKKYFERKPLKGQALIGEDKDGSIEIEIKITNEMEIIPLILYYIPYIKVLEPQWLADVVKDKVQGYLKEL